MVSPYAEFTVYNPRPGLRTAAEIKRQKTRRQEGAAFDAIFLLLLRGHRQSPRRRRGASFPAPRCPGARGSGCRGQRLLPDTPPPPGLWRCTFWSPPRVTFHHAGPQLLLPPFSALALGTLGCSSRDRRPALPGRPLSNSERCTWFFSAGLLFPFSWNNNNNNSGSGSVHKKPGARKESSGMATGSGGSRRSGLLRWQQRWQ